MMQRQDGSLEKIERKIIEKNRRTQMKTLCFKLNSLVPSLLSQPSKLITQESQFNHSIAHIEELKKRIDILKDNRDKLINGEKDNKFYNFRDGQPDDAVSCDSVTIPPAMELQELEGGLKVIFISNPERKDLFSKIIGIVEDGGAEVVKGGYATLVDKVIYTIHAKVQITLIYHVNPPFRKAQA
ncbi:hypothetical protein E3N88_10196 [Mikania micrantha]|uniref:BHLH domain-containing protein n=1 Tax=Mikania micrantha TaxID=192012 RepID=A0A5N6P9Z9_9ASTR|nr:hypothetical protein E3N88_10196 [Mikania micrantha]